MGLIQSRKLPFHNIILLNLLVLILYIKPDEVPSSKKGLIWTFKGESQVLIYSFKVCKWLFPFKKSCSLFTKIPTHEILFYSVAPSALP